MPAQLVSSLLAHAEELGDVDQAKQFRRVISWLCRKFESPRHGHSGLFTIA